MQRPLSANSTAVVAEFGGGTGFYTGTVARDAKRVYGLGLQVKTHDYGREKGVPGNVEFVTTDATDSPFDDRSPDAALPTMTYHELASTDALREG
jgi:ubiquinone/menaquinone biosynthesis C-methylase UbiE